MLTIQNYLAIEKTITAANDMNIRGANIAPAPGNIAPSIANKTITPQHPSPGLVPLLLPPLGWGG